MKRIFITGASSGIGLATAKLLAERGDEVWGTSRDRARIPALPRLHPVELDRGPFLWKVGGYGDQNGIILSHWFFDLKGDGGKRIAALLIGKKYLKQSDGSPLGQEAGGIPSGRYARTLDKSNRVVLVAETLDEVDSKPDRWLNRDFFKIENAKSITLAGASPAMNWKITHDAATSPWTLADAKPGEELDVTKASAAAALFSYGVFADVMAPDAPATETGLDKPAVATIETFDGFVYTLKIGKPVGENYPVLVSVTANLPKERTPVPDEKPEDKAKLDQEFQTKQTQLTEKLAKEQKIENRPYLIAKTTVEQLLKERSTLLAEKKPTPTPPPTAGTPAPAPGTPKPAPTQKPRK